jgi:hypothetical protein
VLGLKHIAGSCDQPDVRVGSVKRIKADFTDASGMMGLRPQVILSSVKAMSDAAAMVRKEIS